ncbi:MAG: ribonuclease R family protein [Chitinophagaceae bacterium]
MNLKSKQNKKYKPNFSEKKVPPKKVIFTDKIVQGIIQINQFGKGFVSSAGYTKDIEISSRNLNTALNGDTVKVKIATSLGNNNRIQGKVDEVITRKQNHFIGKLVFQRKKILFFPESSYRIPIFLVERSSLPLKIDNNELIVVEFKRWAKNEKPMCYFLHTCANWSKTKIAYQKILMAQGFGTEFSDAVMQEAETFHKKQFFKIEKKRKDFREFTTFTIDPDDAKDFDDAISFKKIEKNLFEIGVHIADVTHFVKENSAINEHAEQTTTSVYLPGKVIPMLPEILSNNICSLVPYEDRFCFAAIFQITEQGIIKKVDFSKTCISSNRRFTYNEVQCIIDTKEGDFKEEILSLYEITQHLRKQRMKHGAINFSSQDLQIKLDENFYPTAVIQKESSTSHELVEELMLLANREVAKFVHEKINKELYFPFRIHDQPDESKLDVFIQFAKQKGYKILKNTPQEISDSFNKMLQESKGKPECSVLQTIGIRSMAKAQYDIKNIGHFGLGFPYYCHFTSPIRRYPDVIVHRILESILEDKYKSEKELKKQCLICNDRERAAMECERAAIKYKIIEFIQSKIGEEFEAIVCGVSSSGFWAESLLYRAEGFVSKENFDSKNNFVFMEKEFMLYNKSSNEKIQMGDKIKVKLINASLETLKVDYLWVKELRNKNR